MSGASAERTTRNAATAARFLMAAVFFRSKRIDHASLRNQKDFQKQQMFFFHTFFSASLDTLSSSAAKRERFARLNEQDKPG